jgi:hypothetical protein
MGKSMSVEIKKKRGRPPKQIGQMTVTDLAKQKQDLLPVTEGQRLKALKNILINSAGTNVVHKAIEIAMNDEHPAQASMIKLLMDRTLPVSMFEKEKNQRSAVTINITGIGDSPISIGSSDEPEPEIIDVEDKNGFK